MAKFEHESVVDALERSLRNADLKARQAAVVAGARLLAKRIDQISASGWIDDNGKLDNVSVPTFLKYCEKLGLTLEVEKPPKRVEKAVEQKPLSKMSAFASEISKIEKG